MQCRSANPTKKVEGGGLIIEIFPLAFASRTTTIDSQKLWQIKREIPKASKDRERNVRYIKGGLLRKGGYLANVDGGPKKQHFPAFSQKFYFALIRRNSHI